MMRHACELVSTVLIGLTLAGVTACERQVLMASNSGAATLDRPQSITCDSAATCFVDTAIVTDVDYEPGRLIAADWLLFAARDDSIELHASSTNGKQRVSLSASYGTKYGHQERDSLGNTSSRNHFRMPHDGVTALYVSVADNGLVDTVEYVLAMRRITNQRAAGAMAATGDVATLTVVAKPETKRFTIMPASVYRLSSEKSSVGFLPRRYKVALVRDSLYVLCPAQCTAPDTVKLRPSTSITVSY
jgi:hypothetical protein